MTKNPAKRSSKKTINDYVPLRARLARGVLTIEISIDTLAWAFEESDYNVEASDHRPDFVKKMRVINKREFAEDVIREMHDEAEDGSTPLTNFINATCIQAVEQGSCAIEDREDASK